MGLGSEQTQAPFDRPNMKGESRSRVTIPEELQRCNSFIEKG